MDSKRLFLRWALFASLIAVGACIAGSLGWLSQLYHDDRTYFTYGITATFLVATVWCGKLTWSLTKGEDPFLVRIHHEDGWFASSACVTFGMIGTAIGFLIMYLQGIPGGDPTSAIASIMANARIAIVNTIFGGICGFLVEVQSHFIGKAIKMALYRLGWVVDDNGALVQIKRGE